MLNVTSPSDRKARTPAAAGLKSMLDVFNLAVLLKITEATASMNGGAQLLGLRGEERNLPPCQRWEVYLPILLP